VVENGVGKTVKPFRRLLQKSGQKNITMKYNDSNDKMNERDESREKEYNTRWIRE
jgi:hypothetical protein